MGSQDKEKEAVNYLYPPVPNNFKAALCCKNMDKEMKAERKVTESSLLRDPSSFQVQILPHPSVLGALFKIIKRRSIYSYFEQRNVEIIFNFFFFT